MKTVTIEIPDDSELIKEGDNYRIRQIIPVTWEEFCKHNNVGTKYYIDTFSQIQEMSIEYKKQYDERNKNLCEFRELSYSSFS